MNWFSNNLNWLIYVFVLVIPVMSSIGKWLQQQAAKKRAEAEQRRRAESQLRTGRVDTGVEAAPGTSPASSSSAEPPENFAERRRRQIEELKRRQEAAQRQRDAAQRTPKPAPAAPAPAPTGSGSRAEAPPRQRDQRRTPAPAGPTMSAKAAPAARSASTAEIETLAEMFERRDVSERAGRSAILPVVGKGGSRQSLDRESLRRAVVLAEVLAKPVALRPEGQHAV